MGGWVEEKSRIQTNSAKLKLELRLSLAKIHFSRNEFETNGYDPDTVFNNSFVKNFLMNKTVNVPYETLLIPSAVQELTKKIKAKEMYCFRTKIKESGGQSGWCPTCQVKIKFFE